jgi:hypothetical protein
VVRLNSAADDVDGGRKRQIALLHHPPRVTRNKSNPQGDVAFAAVARSSVLLLIVGLDRCRPIRPTENPISIERRVATGLGQTGIRLMLNGSPGAEDEGAGHGQLIPAQRSQVGARDSSSKAENSPRPPPAPAPRREEPTLKGDLKLDWIFLTRIRGICRKSKAQTARIPRG